MPNAQQRQQEIAQLREYWDLLSEKLAGLERERIRETRSDEKFRIEQTIAETTAERRDIEERLRELDSRWRTALKFLKNGLIVVAILAGAWLFVKLMFPPYQFPLTVYVHGSKGQQDIVLHNSGEVLLDLGEDYQTKKIGDNGIAYFPTIPGKFRYQPVAVIVKADGFTLAHPEQEYVLSSNSLHLEVKPDGSLANVFGTVQNADGALLPGVQIRIDELRTQTDASGYFSLDIPPDKQQKQHALTASKDGYRTYDAFVYPASKQDVKIILERQ